MSSSRNGLIGLGIGLGVAGAATAAGLVADRVHKRRQNALETGVSLVEQPSEERVVVATDGVRLHVEVDEPSSGGLAEDGRVRPTVVMSHGFCLTSECWVFQRRYLRWAGYRVVVWDHRGHGRSDRGDVASYTIAQLGEDLVRVIDAVAPEGPLVLVGHSMGGMTTMALGTLYPDLVRDRVVAFGAISTSAGGMPLASGRFAAAMGRLLIERLGPGVAGVFEHRPELLKNLLSANSELAEFFVERYSFASPVPRSVVKLAARMLLGTNLTVLSSFTPAFDNYDQTAGLVAFQGCETLVFNGEQDLVTPPEHSEAIVRALPGAQHVIVRDAGHVIMLEHPDLLNQQLDALIERAGRRAEEQQPADLSPRVRRVVTDVGKKRRIERGLERMDGQRRSAPGNRSTRERRREAS